MTKYENKNAVGYESPDCFSCELTQRSSICEASPALLDLQEESWYKEDF